MQADQVYAQLGALTFGAVDLYGVEWTLKMLEGWTDAGSTLSITPKPRASGAWGGNAYQPARHVAMGGLIIAPTALLLSAAIDRLLDACSLDDTTFTVTEAGRSRWANARRNGDVIVRYLMPTIATYSVQVVAVDPRKFGATLTGSTALPQTTGGLSIPYTIPYTIPALTVSGQVSLTNPGNETGPVTIRIDGPCSGPVITHVGSKLALTFSSSLVLNAGEFLLIDLEARTVMANGQSSRNRYITSRGWFGLEPGNNTFAFTANTFNAASLMTVTAIAADK